MAGAPPVPLVHIQRGQAGKYTPRTLCGLESAGLRTVPWGHTGHTTCKPCLMRYYAEQGQARERQRRYHQRQAHRSTRHVRPAS